MPYLARIAAPLLLLAGLACARLDAAPEGRVRLAVQRGQFTSEVLLTGELKAEDAIFFVTPNANIWPVRIQWLAKDGAELDAGDLVVEFDNSRLTANLEELRNAVLTAREALDRTRADMAARREETGFALLEAEARVEKARLEAAVPSELFAAKVFEQRQLELHRAELELSEARAKRVAAEEGGAAEVELKRVELEKARLAVDLDERRVALLSLRAPRPGVLLRHENRQEGQRPFEIGDDSWPGSPVASLPDLQTMIVEASLYDVDDGRVAPGQVVRATLDAYPDRVYPGRVRSVDPLAKLPSARATRRVFRVLVDLDEVDTERMRPGMSVKLEIAGPVLDDALLVPRAAIDFSAEPATALLADGGRAPLELGPCAAEHCVARSGVMAGQALRAVRDLAEGGS